MNCKRCDLFKFRKKIVRPRGAVPADILFIGEAPTEAENIIGKCFIGKRGKIIEDAIKDAYGLSGIKKIPKIHFTYMCRCIPKDTKRGEVRSLTEKEVESCWTYLEQVYLKVKPKFVIFLGRDVEKFLQKKISNGKYFFTPDYLLMNDGQSGIVYKEFVRELSELFKSVERIKRIWNTQ